MDNGFENMQAKFETDKGPTMRNIKMQAINKY